jgi:hypothetical protein
MKTLLWILAGAIFMILIIKIVGSGKDATNSKTGTNVKQLLKTQQFLNLVKTNEFREMIKTNEFKKVVASLATDQLVSLSIALSGATINK